MFEGESREIYKFREQIVTALGLEKGDTVIDVGAGTGFFARLFAERVGAAGKVYAVDISPPLLAHMRQLHAELGIDNIEVVEGGEREINVGAVGADTVVICDTYHHFEYPHSVLESIHDAPRPRR